MTTAIEFTAIVLTWLSMQLHLIYSRLMSINYTVPGMPTFQKENFHVPARLIVVAAVAAVVYLHHVHGLC